MYTLHIHRNAEADFEALQKSDPSAATRIVVVLQEIQGDQHLLDSLLDHDFGKDGTERFHVSKWHEYWRQQLDLWRLKIWSLEYSKKRYRVIYAYDIPSRRFHILAIVSRDFDYDPDDPRSKRILEAYRDLF